MTTISFKAKDDLRKKLVTLAEYKGINLSALIKMFLTETINSKLNQMTENGITLKEELSIMESDMNDEVSGPYKTVSQLKKALKK